MIRVFVSYSHADEKYHTELVKHLKILERQGIIETWHDKCIAPGEEWSSSIDNELRRADIILLLISIDFIISKYCFDLELNEAIERHNRQEVVVIPVILRACHWTGLSFGKLQAATKNGKPVDKYPSLDDAFFEITKNIETIAKQLSSKSSTSTAKLSATTGPHQKRSSHGSSASLLTLKNSVWLLTIGLGVVFIAVLVLTNLLQNVEDTPPTQVQAMPVSASSEAGLGNANNPQTAPTSATIPSIYDTSQPVTGNEKGNLTTANANSWVQRGCDWAISNQNTFVSQGGEKNCELIYKFPIKAPYKISVDVTPKNGAHKAAIIFNIEGSSFYQFEIEANFAKNTGIVRLWDSTTWDNENYLYSIKTNLSPNKSISLCVEVRDMMTIFYVNGQSIFSYKCSIKPNTKVGIRSAWTEANFKNLSITKL